MSAAAVKSPDRISYEDFLASVDEGTHAEWVDGAVVYMSPASREHVRITAFLFAALRFYVQARGVRGEVLHAPVLLKLGTSAREPDLVFIDEEGLPRFGEQHIEGPADLVVEVAGPDSRTRDRIEKFREYEQAGVREYWLIDPARKRAEVHRLSAAGVYEPMPAGDPPRLRSEVIPGLWIDPAWLWAERPDEWVAYREWGLI